MNKLILILLLIPSLSYGDKLIVGGVSKHFVGAPYELNERHNALGIEKDGYEAGIYKNSVNSKSIFISKIARPWKLKDGFSAGYRFGIANGYDVVIETRDSDGAFRDRQVSKSGLIPQAQFLISHESKYLTVDLGLAPVSTLIFKVNL